MSEQLAFGFREPSRKPQPVSAVAHYWRTRDHDAPDFWRVLDALALAERLRKEGSP